VVRPHDEADDADRDHGVGHAEIAEDRLLREGRDDVADDAEARQDQDVDFGVAEEPEQMLEQDRVAAAGRIEEGGAEVAVGQQHGDARRPEPAATAAAGTPSPAPTRRTAASCAASCPARAC
jgi:hypothetical protein